MRKASACAAGRRELAEARCLAKCARRAASAARPEVRRREAAGTPGAEAEPRRALRKEAGIAAALVWRETHTGA